MTLDSDLPIIEPQRPTGFGVLVVPDDAYVTFGGLSVDRGDRERTYAETAAEASRPMLTRPEKSSEVRAVFLTSRPSGLV